MSDDIQKTYVFQCISQEKNRMIFHFFIIQYKLVYHKRLGTLKRIFSSFSAYLNVRN